MFVAALTAYTARFSPFQLQRGLGVAIAPRGNRGYNHTRHPMARWLTPGQTPSEWQQLLNTVQSGNRLEAEAYDESGKAQGRFTVLVLRQVYPRLLQGAAVEVGVWFEGAHQGASDEYYQWWASEGEGRFQRIFHICPCPRDHCQGLHLHLETGAIDVIHIDRARRVARSPSYAAGHQHPKLGPPSSLNQEVEASQQAAFLPIRPDPAVVATSSQRAIDLTGSQEADERAGLGNGDSAAVIPAVGGTESESPLARHLSNLSTALTTGASRAPFRPEHPNPSLEGLQEEVRQLGLGGGGAKDQAPPQKRRTRTSDLGNGLRTRSLQDIITSRAQGQTGIQRGGTVDQPRQLEDNRTPPGASGLNEGDP